MNVGLSIVILKITAMKKNILYLSLFFMQIIIAQSYSEFIHIDQFGYLPDAEKIAVISDPQIGFNSDTSFSPSGTLELRNATTDEVVYSGAPVIWRNGETHTQSGDKGWWFDFSDYTIDGEYYIHDPVNTESSAIFKIQENVYQDVLKAAARMFYYNRCNSAKALPYAESPWVDDVDFLNPLQDANCRNIFDRDNISLEKDLSGGWFDAGDYNKYVTFAYTAINDLLWAYEENPQAFGENWNIPESGNGIPDIIDEIKWELDWLIKMNNSDGSTIIKMGSQNHNENVISPPSLNTDQRFYGNTCTSASIAIAGMFAHAAQVFKNISSLTTYAQELEQRAIQSWSYVVPFLNSNTLETECDNGEIISGDADWDATKQKENAVAVAVHLYRLTNDDAYNQYVINNYTIISGIQNNFFDFNTMPISDALLLYTVLPGADSSASQEIIQAYSNDSRNNYSGYYGTTDNDLYLAHAPDWAYDWGSNSSKSVTSNLNTLIGKRGINPGSSDSYIGYSGRAIHYFHGVNPIGKTYLTNMSAYDAENSSNEMFHTWFSDGTDWDSASSSLYGPPPGFLVGGPNANFSVQSLSPPYGQPGQKSFLDFNTNWPFNSWEITEPGIYYQAAYIRMLANHVTNLEETLGVTDNFVSKKRIQIYPNPANEYLNMIGVKPGNKIYIHDMLGKEIFSTIAKTIDEISVPTDILNSGVYIIRVEKDQSGIEAYTFLKR